MRKTGECDVDELIANLQSTYPEYSRRKKHVFQNLVGKLYRSLGLDSSNQFSDDQTLEEAERRHFEKRMREANQDQDNGLCVVIGEACTGQNADSACLILHWIQCKKWACTLRHIRSIL